MPSDLAIVTRSNAELANSFGNLAQRSLSMIFKNLDGKLAVQDDDHADDARLRETVAASIAALRDQFTALAFSDGLEAWMRAVFACNQYVDEQAPWALRKTDPQRMQTVLATLYIAIAQLAVAILPVIPRSEERRVGKECRL